MRADGPKNDNVVKITWTGADVVQITTAIVNFTCLCCYPDNSFR